MTSATERKSRYARPSAAARTWSGGAGFIDRTRAPSGIEETTWLAGYSTRPSGVSATTATAPPSHQRTSLTAALEMICDPWHSASSAARSHVIPGPYLGYWNSSIKLVILVLPFGRMALVTAFSSERFLIRCAAQSAWIWVAGTPHSF